MGRTFVRHLFTAWLVGHISLPGTAQQPVDPPALSQRVRVLGQEDDLPRPGVLLHVIDAGSASVGVDTDGWLHAVDDRVRGLLTATTLRTDPDGCVVLTPRLVGQQIVVGGPFYLARNPELRDGENELLLRVGRLEPVGVRVVDADGKPLGRFPVALHAAGKDLAVALSDDDGNALLGMPAGFTARIVVAPAGWVGPKEGFPTIAEALQGRRSARLQVPPHGSLRLRRTRGGVPERAHTIVVGFHDPISYVPLLAPPNGSAPDAIGIVYDRVALGVELGAYTPFGGHGLWQGRGPERAGEDKVVDVDLGPRLLLQLPGIDAARLQNGLRLHLVSDTETLDLYASVDPEGRAVIDLRGNLRGTRLRRVDFDAGLLAASVPFDLPLRGAQLDLGAIPLLEHAPQVCGTVRDAAGVATAEAEVTVSPADRPGTGFVLRSDAKGLFRAQGPLLRAADGAIAAVVVSARLGTRRSEPSAPIALGGEIELVLREPAAGAAVPPARAGRLVARIAPVDGVPDQVPLGGPEQTSFRLSGPRGSFSPVASVRKADGCTEVVFENLLAGRYQLRAQTPELGGFVALADLEVPDRGDCRDPRLERLDPLATTRPVVVEVVDAQGIPIAGARLLGAEVVRESDRAGLIGLRAPRESPFTATVEAPGKRPQRLVEWPARQRVVLEAAGGLTVEVRGLPADLPRERIEVWVRDEVRERFAGPRALVGTDGVARMAVPARGRYVLWLLVTQAAGRGESRWEGVYTDPVPVVVGDQAEQSFVLQLDEAAVVRLRKALAADAAGKK